MCSVMFAGELFWISRTTQKRLDDLKEVEKPRRNLRKIREKFILNIININLNIKPKKFIVKIQYFFVLKLNIYLWRQKRGNPSAKYFAAQGQYKLA